MAVSKTSICNFRWKARGFALKGIDGKTYTLAGVRGSKGTLVALICNHCPYVKASVGRIVAEANALRETGIGTLSRPGGADAPNGMFDQMEGLRGRSTLPRRAFRSSKEQLRHLAESRACKFAP